MFEREIEALTMLGGRNSTMTEGTFPKLLGADHQLRLLALLWIDARPIGPVLRRSVHRLGSKADLDIGRDATYCVGTWLRDFENATKADECSYPSAEISRRIAELLNLVSTDNILSKSDLSTIQAVSSKLGSTVRSKYKAALAHCDFWFDHILLINRKTVAVLDYGRSIYSPCGRDAVEFVLRLQDFCAGNPFVSHKKVALLEMAFFSGYGEVDIAEPGLRLFAIMRRLEQLGGLVERRPIGFLDKVVLQNRKTALARWLQQSVIR